MADEASTAPKESAITSFLSGGFGGMSLVLVGHPFDLVKVRMQTMHVAKGEKPPYKNAMDCALQTVKKEGPRGLYRGMSAPLMGVTPIFAVNFWGFEMGKRFVRWAGNTPDDQQLSLFQIGIAGGLGAIPTTAIMAPGERIKCVLQVQGQQATQGPKLTGPVEVVKHLYAEGGLRSIFRGSAATLLRDGSGSLAYFSVYEGMKRGLTRSGTELSPLAVLTAGGLAGVFNWVVAIGPDTVKSRLQTAPEGTYRNFIHAYKSIVAEGGYPALFRGVGPAMLRAFPANAACFLGVEVSKKAMHAIGM